MTKSTQLFDITNRHINAMVQELKQAGLIAFPAAEVTEEVLVRYMVDAVWDALFTFELFKTEG